MEREREMLLQSHTAQCNMFLNNYSESQTNVDSSIDYLRMTQVGSRITYHRDPTRTGIQIYDGIKQAFTKPTLVRHKIINKAMSQSITNYLKQSLQRNDLFELLGKLTSWRKDIRVIQNIHQKKIWVQIENDLRKYIKLERGKMYLLTKFIQLVQQGDPKRIKISNRICYRWASS